MVPSWPQNSHGQLAAVLTQLCDKLEQSLAVLDGLGSMGRNR
jgi:hypothetical protein